jgi:ubiquitin-conjugating enzyme E2 Z
MTNNGNTRFHPNFYKNGKVCVSILNTWYNGERWSACQTIQTILLSICSLFIDTPLENEPNHTKFFDPIECLAYEKSIEFANIDFAICHMVTSNDPRFQLFKDYMTKHFVSNYQVLLKKVTKLAEDKQSERILISFYNMQTTINYVFLLDKLKRTEQTLFSLK